MKKLLITITTIILGLFLTSCVFSNGPTDSIEIPKIETITYVGKNENIKEYLILYEDGSTQQIFINDEEETSFEFSFDDLYQGVLDYGFNGTFLDFINKFINEEVTVTNKDAIRKGLKSTVSIFSNFTTTEATGYSIGGVPQKNTVEYTSAGSGIIYKLDKEAGNAYIITNHHVVYDSNSDTSNKISNDIEIYLYGLELLEYQINATYIAGSETHDIAVLKITNSEILKNSIAEEASYANSDDIEAGNVAIAIGNPKARGISATLGIISVESEYITINSSSSEQITYRVMRIDTAINGGNSGGGLFNEKGEVIGIVNAKMIDSSIDGIGYAIPSNIVFAIADNLIYNYVNKSSENGEKLFLGVTVKVDKREVYFDEVKDKIVIYETIKVDQINVGSLASQHFKIGDEIVSITINGERYVVNRLFQISDILLKVRRNSILVFNVLRNQEEVDLEISFKNSDFQLIN